MSKHKLISTYIMNWLILLLCWFALHVAIFLPWDIPATRYLLPSVAGISLFMGIVISKGWELFWATKSVNTPTLHIRILSSLILCTLLRLALIPFSLPNWSLLILGMIWCMLLVLEASWLLIYFNKHNVIDKAGRIFILSIFMIAVVDFSLENALLTWHEAHVIVGRESANRSLVIWLGKNSLSQSRIALNFTNKNDGGEVITQMGYQLDLLEDRRDVTLEYLSLNDPDPDYILFWGRYYKYTLEDLKAKYGNQLKPVKTIRYSWFRFYTNSTSLIKWWATGSQLFYRKGSVFRGWEVYKIQPENNEGSTINEHITYETDNPLTGRL